MSTSSIRIRTLGFMSGLVSTLAIALSAQAGDVQQTTAVIHESAVVRFDDLSLESSAGIKALYARLSNAAERVCGGQPNKMELRQLGAYRNCYHSALSKAVDKVGNDQLHALHQADTRSNKVG